MKPIAQLVDFKFLIVLAADSLYMDKIHVVIGAGCDEVVFTGVDIQRDYFRRVELADI